MDHLLALVAADAQPTDARTFTDCGYTQTPYGLVLRLPTGALVYWQTVATAWPGDDYGKPEQPAHGPPPTPLSMPVLPTAGITRMVQVERYAGALLTSGDTEVASVALYADKPKPGAIPYGLTVRFHNGSVIYLYARHMFPAGHDLRPGDAPFRRRDAI